MSDQAPDETAGPVLLFFQETITPEVTADDQSDLQTYHVTAPFVAGETAEEFVSGMNARRQSVKEAREVVRTANQALREANAGEAREVAAWKSFLAKWCKAIDLKVGQFRRFVTDVDGKRMIIVLSQPTPGVYGCAYVPEG